MNADLKTSGRASEFTAPRLIGPLKVSTADISETIDDLDCSRAAGSPYEGAWILVCDAGYPLGCIEIPASGGTINADDIKQEIERQLGSARAAGFPPLASPAPKISIVVPTNFARPEQLARCADRLTKLDYPDYEVIIADNRPASVPVGELPGVRVVKEPHPGISAARNRGIEAATGEIIAFTDDDVVVDRRWLQAIAARFAQDLQVVAVTGLVVPLELETRAQVLFEQSGNALDYSFQPLTFELAGRFQKRRRVLATGDERVDSIYKVGDLGAGSNMAYRASVLRQKGGFDLALGIGTPTCGGEDLAMLLELLRDGHRLAYEPGAMIHHSNRATMEELERQLHGYAIGFTAMLTAITLRDPWHVLGLAAIVPNWLQSLRDPSSAKQARRTTEYPPALGRAEMRGLIAGPSTYLRSRRMNRVKLA